MDRNSAIGLTLIAAMLLVYFNFLAPPPPAPEKKPTQITTTEPSKKDSTKQTVSIASDSTLRKQYGDLATLLTGAEEFTTVKNDALELIFTSKGYLNSVELLNFKTYTQMPLKLVTPGSNHFSLTLQHEGRLVDLYQLYYKTETLKTGDTTRVMFTAHFGDQGFIRHTYSIPQEGYKIGYALELKGVDIGNKNLVFHWDDQIPLQEKDIEDSRKRTTVNYYTVQGEFEGLNESTTDAVSDKTDKSVRWVAIRQKFFISSIIAQNNFSGLEIKSSITSSDSIVKNAVVDLNIAATDVPKGKLQFSYFFGPNEYDLIQGVTEGFSRNLYLGWPPVIWVNKFIIIPIFRFLEGFIGNYGIIIMLLVLFVKLLLTPLSYSSYMGMAKMKLLKPELDAIKEKNGDNATQAQQDQMKLYQQAGVNPFAGCIPLVLQMPILFAMFYFFPVSIELRQKPFLWAEDLSTYDSVLNLPFTIPFYGDHVSLFVLLMTASTLVYTWQNNQISSVQGPMKSMSYIMPVIFMFVLNQFSAGLSFYYFVSNLVTFAQQAIIKRFVDEDKIKAIMEKNKAKAASGTGKKSKFMSKLEEAMKASAESRKKGNPKH